MGRAKVLLVSILLSGCGLMGEGAPFQVIDGASEPLRGQFNDDVGKVRIVMLASPT